MKRHRSTAAAFTLIELLVVFVVIAVLITLIYTGINGMIDRARTTQCIANLRSIVAGTIAYTGDRDGMLWSMSEIGYSKYRMVDDPKGPPELMKAYVPTKLWLCPGGRTSLAKFGNNYTWTVASQFDRIPITAVDNPASTLLYWDVFAYSLPSMRGASEDVKGNGSTGPASLPSKMQMKPHNGRSQVNYAYLDGHVETR